MSRFTRQIRLAEVGAAGQAKLSAARVATQNELEATYLRAAGVTVVDGPRDIVVPDLGFRHAAARDVGAAAYAALVAIRAELGI